MTDLTEQWKKGELPDDEYYCRTTHDSSVHKHYLSDIDNENMIEVLAPVPSYEEWEKLNWYAGNGVEENQELKMENAKLKELLKEVEYYLPEFETPMNILAKIDEALQ